MKITNLSKLPEPVYKALADSVDSYEKHGDFSVTELLRPPRAAVLAARHKDKIENDCLTYSWSLRGRAMHYIMAAAKMKGAIIEERFIIPVAVGGRTWNISFQPDYCWPYMPNTYELLDFKDTSIHAIGEGPKPEWVQQMNLYKWGFRKRGFNVNSLKIVAWLRDWSYTECHTKKKQGYPSQEIMPIYIPLWTDAQAFEFMAERIRLHAEAKTLPDSELPECSVQERWGKASCYAVIYKDGKSEGNAIRGGASCKTRAAAIAMQMERAAKKGSATEIEFRPGTNTRCERYCDAAPFCNQWKQIRNNPF